MKKLIVFAVLLCQVAMLKAQKVINDPNAEVRNVSGFSTISVSGGIDLYLSPGDEAVVVSASDPKFRERIKTEVKDGSLKIWFDAKSGININFNDNRRLKAYVSYKTLKALSASGGSDVSVEGTITGSELRMDLAGGADFRGKVDVENLRVNQTGGCDVSISGKAKVLSVDANGGSDFNGYGLTAEICDLEASGGCDIEITASKELSARANGASDIKYKGNPNVKEAKASGASSVKSRS